MSVKVMGMVWDLDISPNWKLVLLAYADHADHAGDNIYPSVDLVASKTGYSPRHVRRITRELRDAGLLFPMGTTGLGTNLYRYGGDILSGGGMTSCQGGDDSHVRGGMTPMSGGGMTPESSEPSVKPSVKPSEEDARARPEIFKIFEAEIGPITPHIADALKALEEDHPPEWIVAALRDASARGKRNLKYVQAILKRWAVEGYGTAPPWERESGGQRPTGSRSKQNQSEPAGYEALRRYAEKHGIGEQHDGK